MALLEKILEQDMLIVSSIMFGQGRFNAGVLIDPVTGQGFDPLDETLLEAFRNKIWLASPCHRYLILPDTLRIGPQWSA
jgi:hypothetical protein